MQRARQMDGQWCGIRPGLLAMVVTAVLLPGWPLPTVQAQLPQTRITSVFPPGGRIGSTVEVRVTGGSDLDQIDRLVFDRSDMTATPKMQGTGAARKPVANTFLVSIGSKVPPGLYEIRAHGLYGLSNPRTFVVSDRKELLEAEPNNTMSQAAKIELNTIVNGTSGRRADLDFYTFQGRKGQRVIISIRAARIDSPMSAAIEVYDSNRRRIATSHDRIRRDPLADLTLPADGAYFIKVYDFVYSGGAQYVYRLSASTGPHIDFVLPSAGLPGRTGSFTLYGRNLPGGQPAGRSADGRPLEKLTVSISLPADSSILQPGENIESFEAGLDGIHYVLNSAAGRSNPVRIHFASAPVTLEKEPNDTGPTAQHIAVPAEFVGRFQKVEDTDCVSFTARKGDEYIVEVFGQRDGTPVDPFFVLEQVTRDKKGAENIRRITIQDDNASDFSSGIFPTNSDDPAYRLRVPADGSYRIVLRDRYFETRGDPAMVYRLSIRRPHPDFRLIALPVLAGQGRNQGGKAWAVGLRKGDNVSVQILAFRRDGFDGPIDVRAEGLPKGVTCKGATIGTGSNVTTLIFTAAENAAPWLGPIRVLGRAKIDQPDAVKAETAAQKSLAAAVASLSALSKNVQTAAAAVKKSEPLKTTREKKAAADAAAAKSAAEAQTAAAKRLAAAITAAKQAVAANTQAKKQVVDTAAAVKSAAAKLTAAAAAAKKSPKDKKLAAAVIAAQKAHAAAAAAAQTASAALSTANKRAAATAKAVRNSTAAKLAADRRAAATAATAKASEQLRTAAVAVYSRAVAKLKAAQQAQSAGKQRIADAKAALAKAENARKAAVHQVERPARPATIVRDGSATTATLARLARSLDLSVMNETAPFQVVAGLFRVRANQGRQILIPVKLLKRAGFDDKVALTFVGLPGKTNVQLTNKPINKGKSSELLPVFVKNNAKLGTYTLYLKAQGQVSYRRNLARLALAETAQKKAAVAAAAAATAAKIATTAQTAAAKKFNASNTALKAAQSRRDAARKTARASAKAAKQANALRAKAATAAAASAKAAQDAANKVAVAEKAAKAKPKDKALATAAAKAKQRAASLAVIAKKSGDANKAAAAKSATTQTIAANAAATLATLDKGVQAAVAALKTVQQAKAAADAAAKTAAARAKAAAAAKTAADKRLAAAKKAAAPKKIAWAPPSTPIIIDVVRAPASLSASVPAGGNLKRGKTLAIKVTLKRLNGFTGPVRLSLPLPPGIKGLTAPPVTIPAGKTTAVLSVQAAADATEGQLANLVIRGGMEFEGQSAVDVPIKVKVSK